jgi:hypothetical protein
MSDTSYSLNDVFANYINSHHPTGPLADIVEILADVGPSRVAVDEVFKGLGKRAAARLSNALLDLLLFYVDFCLGDHELTTDEKLNIKHIKILFHIKEGQLYDLRRDAIKELLRVEMHRIMEDNQIDCIEDLHEVELQAVFDLSYDQYLELTINIASRLEKS